MLKALYLMQKSFNLTESVQFSIGLVIACIVILIFLWLPGILNEK